MKTRTILIVIHYSAAVKYETTIECKIKAIAGQTAKNDTILTIAELKQRYEPKDICITKIKGTFYKHNCRCFQECMIDVSLFNIIVYSHSLHIS